MDKTEKEKRLENEKKHKQAELTKITKKLRWLRTSGQDEAEEKAITEVINKLTAQYPWTEELKSSYDKLSRQYEKRHKKNEEQWKKSARGNNNLSWEKQKEAQEKAQQWYWNEHSKLKNWYQKEEKSLNQTAVKKLVKVKEATARLLLAYYVGMFPKERDYRTLYEGESGKWNYSQKDLERRVGVSEFFTDGFYRDGDMYHGYKKDAFLCAVKQVAPDLANRFSDPQDEISRLEKERASLETEIGDLSAILRAYESLRQFGCDPSEIEQKMPWLLRKVADTFNPQDIKVSADDRAAVLLSHPNFTHHGPGVEYWSLISVYRDGRGKQKYFRFRSPNSESEDNPLNRFEKCLIVSVTDLNVAVRLNGEHGEKIISFSLPKRRE